MSGEPSFSIGELAEAAGVSRRAIRFYVQRGLLPPPLGLGRGRHYGREHLAALERIHQLQAAGHALEAVKRILDGDEPPPPPRTRPYAARTAQRATAELWTRIQLADGAELHVDIGQHDLRVDQLQAIQQAVGKILREDTAGTNNCRPAARSKGRRT
jgi:DNA-binding transcriptional MerR regulator